MDKYCVKTGKHSHATRAKAIAHLKSIRSHNPTYGGRIYACQHCGGFHVGRVFKKKPKKR